MERLTRLAELVKARNQVETEIAAIIGRPGSIGHVGEFIAAQIFAIKLEQSANVEGIDGHFTDGPLTGRTVNIKWYTKRGGILDINPVTPPDSYLVLTGPPNQGSSKVTSLPWTISEVFLFDSVDLIESLKERNVKIGVATSVIKEMWDQARIFPQQRDKQFILTDKQAEALSLFA